jgi:hypothetical protein
MVDVLGYKREEGTRGASQLACSASKGTVRAIK